MPTEPRYTVKDIGRNRWNVIDNKYWGMPVSAPDVNGWDEPLVYSEADARKQCDRLNKEDSP